jgi:ATP-binding protein involved in chromosome partitioning
MTQISQDKIIEVLEKIPAPDGRGNIVERGMVSKPVVKDNSIILTIKYNEKQKELLRDIDKKAENALLTLEGVEKATVILTSERTEAQPAKKEADENYKPQKLDLKGIKTVVAVASGKGGVGKSTTAVNLALALSKMDLKVALFDADIYGPSVPKLMGLDDADLQSTDGKTIIPPEKHGIKCISIGFIVDEDAPIIWRGPLISGALEQFFNEVQWGDVDVMVIDLPPGTGDTQLMMGHKVPLSGAVIVSTPQDLALADAKKGLNMFRKVDVPVFGMIENMSYYECPKCGYKEEIFGCGGAKATAEKLEADFLGAVPLHMSIRKASDEGTPVVISNPEGTHAKAYMEIAAKIKDKLPL